MTDHFAINIHLSNNFYDFQLVLPNDGNFELVAKIDGYLVGESRLKTFFGSWEAELRERTGKAKAKNLPTSKESYFWEIFELFQLHRDRGRDNKADINLSVIVYDKKLSVGLIED